MQTDEVQSTPPTAPQRESATPTPYAVRCLGVDPPMGAGPCTEELVYLTREWYGYEMLQRAGRGWSCPRCHGDAVWDDDNYEARAGEFFGEEQ